jgi:hypothetical protein
MEKDKMLFFERQRFNQVWLWALILMVNFVAIFYLFLPHIFIMHPPGENSLGALLLVLVCLTITTLLYMWRLETMMNSNGIHLKLFPFQRKYRTYTWDEISKVSVREYNPLLEYGGWGYRVTIGNGVAYNIRGNQGIQILIKDGKKILIGTQKPDEVTKVLERFKLN